MMIAVLEEGREMVLVSAGAVFHGGASPGTLQDAQERYDRPPGRSRRRPSQ